MRFMEIIKECTTKDNRKIRLVENTYRDDAIMFDIYGYEYSIQIKFLFFWITIKSYDYTFDAEMNSDEVSKEIDYNKFLAEEYYDFVVNN